MKAHLCPLCDTWVLRGWHCRYHTELLATIARMHPASPAPPNAPFVLEHRKGNEYH